MKRRKFLVTTLVTTSVTVISAAVSGCSGSPSGPDPVTTTPSTPTNTSTQRSPTSSFGTFHRSIYSGSEGTLEYVLNLAKLNPRLNSLGLLVELDGRRSPLVSQVRDPNNGCYFVHVNGSYVGNGSAREMIVPKGVWIDFFDWNGRA